MGRKPSAWRAFVFDGLNWVRLKAPVFGLPLPDDEDFRPWHNFNKFEFYVGTDSIEIRLYNKRADLTCEESLMTGKQCDCTLLEAGACDTVNGTCVDNLCVGGMKEGQACTGDPDCAASYLCGAGMDTHAECGTYDFFCDANLCDGGPKDGQPCTEDADCEGIACIGGGSDGQPCTTDEDCLGYSCFSDIQCRDSLDCDGYFVALVPRKDDPDGDGVYGPFNRIAIGAGKGVDRTDPVVCDWVGWPPALKCVGGPNSGNLCTSDADCPSSIGQCISDVCQGGANHGSACTTNADCPDFQECMDAIGYNDMTVDEVVLYDGVTLSLDGPCCVTTSPGQGTCTITSSATCNGTFLGTYKTCDDCLYDCYADPFADADDDGDVDQDDFALFQRCYSGSGGGITIGNGCHCFDVEADSLGTDPDGDVDQTDYQAFENCASGPSMPANTACDG
jgi:hypothetical protein